MPGIIYKICPHALWREAQHTGEFGGAPLDRQDGFIHFSTAEQVGETAAKHFAGAQDIVLIAVDGGALEAVLKWEPSRGGQLFPHLYRSLPLGAVLWVKPLPLDAGGRHVIPDLSAGSDKSA